MIFVIKKDRKILIQDLPEESEDSYSRVRIQPRHLLKYEIKSVPCVVEPTNEHFDNLKSYINICNVMTTSKVPNKRVMSDVVSGTSKLNRHQEKGYIEITKRYIRKDGTVNLEVTTPNVCFITDFQKQEFFKDLENHGVLLHTRKSSRKVLRKTSEVYKHWSKLMDDEYTRLSGISLGYRKKDTRMNYEGDQYDIWWNLMGEVGKQIFHPFELTPQITILSDLWHDYSDIREFYTIYADSHGDIVFDRDGRFVDIAEDFCKRSLFEILKKLTINELHKMSSLTKMCILKHKYD